MLENGIESSLQENAVAALNANLASAPITASPAVMNTKELLETDKVWRAAPHGMRLTHLLTPITHREITLCRHHTGARSCTCRLSVAFFFLKRIWCNRATALHTFSVSHHTGTSFLYLGVYLTRSSAFSVSDAVPLQAFILLQCHPTTACVL